MLKLDSSEEIGIDCPGCNTSLTIDSAGGYRNFCIDCVALFPEFPNDGNGHLIEGESPNFVWT